MVGAMAARRLPPKVRLLIRLTTAGLAVLVAVTAARMAPLVTKPKAAAPEAFFPEKDKPLEKSGAGLMSALPLSAPPPTANTAEQAATGPKAPPPLDITGLNLKGVFVSMFDNRRSMVIVSQKGGKDLILKRGDMAREGVMLDEVYADHVVFQGINGDKKSLHLSDFIKEAMIMGGGGMPAAPISMADMEDPMGAPIYDPTSPGPGMPGDVSGDGGMDSGPVRYMPIPSMPAVPEGGMTTAAPIVSSSGVEKDISREMNAAQKMGGQGR